MDLFKAKKGIIPALDVPRLDTLDTIVSSTRDLDFIVGYKISMVPVISHGIKKVVETIRNRTSLPIIYDHEKYGTSIPDMAGGAVPGILKIAGVDSLIIFPQAGPDSLRASVKACLNARLLPMVGGEMSHSTYLQGQGGYIIDDAPRRIYEEAAKLGVKHFIVPGTKPERIREYSRTMSKMVQEPRLLFPGIGKGQGGNLKKALEAAAPNPAYAIVGRGIYQESDMRKAAVSLWENAE